MFYRFASCIEKYNYIDRSSLFNAKFLNLLLRWMNYIFHLPLIDYNFMITGKIIPSICSNKYFLRVKLIYSSTPLICGEEPSITFLKIIIIRIRKIFYPWMDNYQLCTANTFHIFPTYFYEKAQCIKVYKHASFEYKPLETMFLWCHFVLYLLEYEIFVRDIFLCFSTSPNVTKQLIAEMRTHKNYDHSQCKNCEIAKSAS